MLCWQLPLCLSSAKCLFQVCVFHQQRSSEQESHEVNTWNVLGTANPGFALPRRRGGAGQVRRGCRRWLASRTAQQELALPSEAAALGHRARAGAPPCSDPAANRLQGPCLCLHPSRPEPAHGGLSPSLLQGQGVSAKPLESCHQRCPCHRRLISLIKHSGPPVCCPWLTAVLSRCSAGWEVAWGQGGAETCQPS